MNASETARRVIESRGGGRVERCHSIPHFGSYSNASHSWGVAMLMNYLWPEDFPRLALSCLAHDVPERITGDIPSPLLNNITGIKEGISILESKINISLGLPTESSLCHEDHVKLKACDYLELWLWGKEQLLLGNRFAEEIILALEDFWLQSPLPKEAGDLKREIEILGVLPERSGLLIKRLLS